MNLEQYIPAEIINFFLVLLFSLLIGLGQRHRHHDDHENQLFGTDRTFAFIGLLGYILLIIDKSNLLPFLTGFVLVGLFLGIFYYQKTKQHRDFGFTSIILALLTYCLPVLVVTQPTWLTLSFVVSILILTELKEFFISLSKKASEEEFITLAKFIAFAGIILPLLPSENISEQIPISPYLLWLAIVAVSGISYVSYLLKKFVFPDSGIQLTGVLGGIYSSTATTIILARREKQEGTGIQSVAAIMMANGMMYLRVLVLAFLFNKEVGMLLTIPFLLLFGFAFLLSQAALKFFKNGANGKQEHSVLAANQNPLELKTATFFGFLFVLFALITDFVMGRYGNSGVTGLAFVVGIFDVDPFLLYLLQTKTGIVQQTIALAIINATNSNNLMKMVYAISMSSKTVRWPLLLTFISLIVFGVGVSVVFLFVVN